MSDRRCAKCGEPLSRNASEADRDWSKRQYCNRSCYVGDRNSKPIWLTFAEKSQRLSNGCIEWTGHRDKKGYGRFACRGGEILAHRIAYVMHHGGTVAGLMVCHRCDNPACINPHHLFVGSAQDNMDDMVRKGRSVPRFGMDNPNYRHGRNCSEQHIREQEG